MKKIKEIPREEAAQMAQMMLMTGKAFDLNNIIKRNINENTLGIKDRKRIINSLRDLTLKEYILEEEMKIGKILEITKAEPFTTETYATSFALLFGTPKFGKEVLNYEISESERKFYIFYVKNEKNQNVAMILQLLNDDWRSYKLNPEELQNVFFHKGEIFLYMEKTNV